MPLFWILPILILAIVVADYLYNAKYKDKDVEVITAETARNMAYGAIYMSSDKQNELIEETLRDLLSKISAKARKGCTECTIDFTARLNKLDKKHQNIFEDKLKDLLVVCGYKSNFFHNPSKKDPNKFKEYSIVVYW